MDASKLKVQIGIVVALLSFAAGFGGTVAVAGAKQSQAMEKIEAQQTQIDTLSKESQANRERVLRIEIMVEQTAKTVERIERKLDRNAR